MTRQCPACETARAKAIGLQSGHTWLECVGCGTWFVAELDDELFDYRFYPSPTEHPAVVTQQLSQLARAFRSSAASQSWLDIGFGGGLMLDCARSAGFITAGNELAVGAVEAAAGRGHDVRLGSLADVGFRRKFDVVSLIEVIEHVPCPRQVVEEAVAHMETDGHLFLTTPNVGSISRRTLGLRWSGVAAPEHLQLFSRRGLHYMLAASNVTPSRCATTGLNLHELRRRAAMAPSTLACERVAAAYALNASLSTTATRRAVKSAANQLLTVLGVGDTIKVTAIR